MRGADTPTPGNETQMRTKKSGTTCCRRSENQEKEVQENKPIKKLKNRIICIEKLMQKQALKRFNAYNFYRIILYIFLFFFNPRKG